MRRSESSESSGNRPASASPRARALATLGELVGDAAAAGDLALARTLARMMRELLDDADDPDVVIEFPSRHKRRP